MSSKKRSRKRGRSPSDNSHNTNNNKKQKTGNVVEILEYFCCVCKELSIGQIFQCPNGCIICCNCYPNLIPCKCPLCRVSMSRNDPIRNRIAEKTLGLRIVKCRNKGCKQAVIFSKLIEHENECEYKPVNCKFNLLGCKWKGLQQSKQKHESKCICDQFEALQIVQQMNDTLEIYKDYVRRCTYLHTEALYVSSEDVFNVSTDSFNFEAYDYHVFIKSERKRIRKKEVYEIYSKIVFCEDAEILGENQTENVNVGIIIDPHGVGKFQFIKESEEIFNHENIESEWTPFERQLSKDEYTKMFRGGFDVRVFCFEEI